MKFKRNLFVLSLSMLLIGFISCSNQDKELKISEEKLGVTNVQEPSKLGEVIVKGIENSNDNFFILYDNSKDDFTILSEGNRGLAELFAQLSVPSKLRSVAPEGDGWILVGKGSSKWDAYRMANKMMSEIADDESFEVRVEREGDIFTVWYRIVKR